jgi:hypothetical protein
MNIIKNTIEHHMYTMRASHVDYANIAKYIIEHYIYTT